MYEYLPHLLNLHYYGFLQGGQSNFDEDRFLYKLRNTKPQKTKSILTIHILCIFRYNAGFYELLLFAILERHIKQ